MEKVKYFPDSGGVVMGIDFGKSEYIGIAVFENNELVYSSQFDMENLDELRKELSELLGED